MSPTSNWQQNMAYTSTKAYTSIKQTFQVGWQNMSWCQNTKMKPVLQSWGNHILPQAMVVNNFDYIIGSRIYKINWNSKQPHVLARGKTCISSG